MRVLLSMKASVVQCIKREVCIGQSQKEQEKWRDISGKVSGIQMLLIQFGEVVVVVVVVVVVAECGGQACCRNRNAGPHHSSPPEPTLVSDEVPYYLQALRAHAPGASWSQPCVPVGHDDIRR